MGRGGCHPSPGLTRLVIGLNVRDSESAERGAPCARSAAIARRRRRAAGSTLWAQLTGLEPFLRLQPSKHRLPGKVATAAEASPRSDLTGLEPFMWGRYHVCSWSVGVSVTACSTIHHPGTKAHRQHILQCSTIQQTPPQPLTRGHHKISNDHNDHD